MLSLGLTGGIAAGKSLLSQRFRELGAIVIDADRIAREVVAPGTDGLRRVVEAFGPGVLAADGSLDRPALGRIVFADEEQRNVLNSIVHPLVRAEAQARHTAAGPHDIVVQDIPLLVETGQGVAFHLVLVVDAPDTVRLARLVEQRGMAAGDARARMAAQAPREARLAAADIVLRNDGEPRDALSALDALWSGRLVPYARNLASGECAVRIGRPQLVPPDPSWPVQAERLAARISRAVGDAAAGVDHVGSTAVAGLPAKDVLDLQLRVRSLAEADRLGPVLAAAGFPLRPGSWTDTPHRFGALPPSGRWEKRFHQSADPGRAVNLHVRVDGSPGATLALAFRDWLRAEPQVRDEYARFKAATAAAHAADASTDGYAQAKEPWFAAAVPQVAAWMRECGWAADTALRSERP